MTQDELLTDAKIRFPLMFPELQLRKTNSLWSLEYENKPGESLLPNGGHLMVTAARKQRGKWHVSGTWPFVNGKMYGGPSIGINVSPLRSSEQIRTDIERRFLPVYVEEFAIIFAQAVDQANAATNRKEAVEDMAKFLGVRVPSYESSRLSAYELNVYEVDVNHNGTEASLRTHSLPIAVVKQLIEVLKANPHK